MFQINHISNKGLLKAVCLSVLLLSALRSMSQERLPHPIKVNVVTTQGLSFGAFTHGSVGGTITVSPTGSRSTTGDVVALNLGYTYTPALFEISADPGTIINILNGSNATLTGPPGGSLTLQIGSSNPSSPFITTAASTSKTLLSVGGTLLVGSPIANPPGNYSGTFNITIIKE